VNANHDYISEYHAALWYEKNKDGETKTLHVDLKVL